MSQSFTIPFGKSKDTPLTSASESDINYCIGIFEKNLGDPAKANYKANNEKHLAAFRAELARRAAGGAVAPAPAAAASRPAPTNEETTRAIEAYRGSHDDAKKATEALSKLNDVGHLVSPAPACGELPEGTSVVISAIMIDAKRETYTVPNGLGIGKTGLQKIAGALGVSWSALESGRLDDGKDPNFVHYRAVGTVRDFDGTLRKIKGEKIVDMRPGSAQCLALQQRAEAKAEREKAEVADWQSQIRDIRLFILEHAETKAQLRAIRSLGLRTSYSKEELTKPFFAARLQFTGRSNDPEIRRLFAEKIASSMLDAEAKLFGPATAPSRPEPHAGGYTPPPVGSRVVDATGTAVDEDDEFGPNGVPVDGNPAQDGEF